MTPMVSEMNWAMMWLVADELVFDPSHSFRLVPTPPPSGIDHNSYGLFFELRAMLIFSRQPQYIKSAP